MNAQFHYLCSFVVKLRIDHDASRDREILANHLDSMNDELKKDDPNTQVVADDKGALKGNLVDHITDQLPNALHAALPALNAYPNDAEVLLLTIIAALMDNQPDQALRFLHRFSKNWRSRAYEDQLLRAIALTQQGLWAQAAMIGKQIGWPNLYSAFIYLPGSWGLRDWAHDWVRQIERFEHREKRSIAAKKSSERRKTGTAKSERAAKPHRQEKARRPQAEEMIQADAAPEMGPSAEPELSELPRYQIRIPLSVEFSEQRMALRYLLSAAGSTSSTAAGAIARHIESRNGGREWRKLQERYAAIAPSGKEQALVELLRRNPTEKKMVFVHHRETLHRLAELVKREGVACERFDGGMTGPEKDAAVRRFYDEVPLLICTESGGEGRNLQFCNTLINFDLPWNPMTIEQRIGRVHRIGQTRDVFIFNLAARGTLEEQVLKILDEKINMFELIVGEIGEILGEMEDEQDFADLVYAAWVETTEAERGSAFEQLGERLVEAKQQYDEVKALDEELFGEEFVTG